MEGEPLLLSILTIRTLMAGPSLFIANFCTYMANNLRIACPRLKKKLYIQHFASFVTGKEKVNVKSFLLVEASTFLSMADAIILIDLLELSSKLAKFDSESIASK